MQREMKENKIKIKNDGMRDIFLSQIGTLVKGMFYIFGFNRPRTSPLFILPGNPEEPRYSSSLAARLAVQLAQWHSKHVIASLSVNFEL